MKPSTTLAKFKSSSTWWFPNKFLILSSFRVTWISFFFVVQERLFFSPLHFFIPPRSQRGKEWPFSAPDSECTSAKVRRTNPPPERLSPPLLQAHFGWQFIGCLLHAISRTNSTWKSSGTEKGCSS